MFHSTRLKLTAWYLLIIMTISVLFSIIIYNGSTQELERSLRTQQFRQYHETHPDEFFVDPHQIPFDPQLLNDAKTRIFFTLALINLSILVISGGAGYFLAGRTLRPIQKMLDEQNRFITDASHELRTPITALRSEIEVNLRDKNLTFAEAKSLLTSNLEEVEHLQILSDNLLQLTQLQKPTQAMLTELRFSEILSEALRTVSPLAKKKAITLKTQITDGTLKGEKQSIIQLLVILLDNAIKYSPEKTTVTITSLIPDHSLHIEIKDEGMGIKKEDLVHIFDRFYRADISRSKQKVLGYGLGLSIAKKIIALHKGSLQVKSELGEGTTFTITLPKHTERNSYI